MVRVGVVWDRTVAFIGDHAGALVPIALGTLVLPNALSGALEPVRAVAPLGTRALIGLVMIAAGLVTIWGQLAITALALEPVEARGGALGEGGRRLPAMVGVSLTLLVAFVVVSLPLWILIYLAGMASMDMAGIQSVATGAARGRILIGVLVMALLLLWIGARLSVLMPVVVAERRGLGAIPRAFALTRGLGLKMAAVILLYVVVLSIASYAAQTVFGTVLALLTGGAGSVTVASVLTALAVAVVAAIFAALASVFTAQLYRAIRAAREGAPGHAAREGAAEA